MANFCQKRGYLYIEYFIFAPRKVATHEERGHQETLS